MAGVQGLQGLTPTVVPTIVEDPGVTLDPSVLGGPYNPAHGDAQWDMGQGSPYPWMIQQGLDQSQIPVPGVESDMLAQVPPNPIADVDPDGYADPTATLSHGGPWPYQHIPNSGAVDNAEVTAMQSLANAELHSIDSGVPASFTTQPMPTHKMPWELSPDYVTSGAPTGNNVGDLAMNNHTGLDRFAGDVVAGDNLNRFGMDSAHVVRQTPVADQRHLMAVPLDTTMGAQRPMVMNVPGRYGSYPVGEGSPFAGQLPGVGNNVGAAELGVPSDYQPPPDPPTNPALASTGSNSYSPPVWGVSGLGF
jgi:hypothetical protein